MNEALQQSLYDKLSREQDKYRDRLLHQEPSEILNHTYEYTIREDIVMEEGGVCENVTIYGGKVSNSACLFVLDMILLVCVLKCLKRGDIFAKRQQ